jgi:hypothetical protein
VGSDITEAELDELEALEKSATPGPFYIIGVNEADERKVATIGRIRAAWYLCRDAIDVTAEQKRADVDLLMRLRNAAPRLLAEIRNLRAANESLRQHNAIIATRSSQAELLVSRSQSAVALLRAEDEIRALMARVAELEGRDGG